MRVLLADDERLVRASLRYMLEELDSTLVFTKEASNGEEMLEIAKESQPDIAFVDIKMPKLTGLEAIKRGKELSPHTQWVILTGYSEFSYAQEAIRLGAANYLLKPASPEDLKKTMLELTEQQKKQLRILQKEFENDMISIFHGLNSFQEIESDFATKDTHYKGAVFYVDSHLEERTKAATLRKMANDLQLLMGEHLVPETRMALFPLPNGELMFNGCWGFTADNKGKEMVDRLIGTFQKRISESVNEDFSITMIESGECSSFEELIDRINRIQTIASYRTFLGIGQTLDFTAVSSQVSQSDTMNILSQLLMRLIHCYKDKNYSEYMISVGELKKYKSTLDKETQARKNIGQFLSAALGLSSIPYTDFETWLSQLQTFGESLLVTQQKETNCQQDLVDQVISYINQHYMNEIGISLIAEKIGVTPNYLSTLFRKKTGTTFMKYLTQTRMIRAKELLLEPDLQVQQVANLVGYYSTRHFTKLFTEFTGSYPSEYKKNKTVV